MALLLKRHVNSSGVDIWCVVPNAVPYDNVIQEVINIGRTHMLTKTDDNQVEEEGRGRGKLSISSPSLFCHQYVHFFIE